MTRILGSRIQSARRFYQQRKQSLKQLLIRKMQFRKLLFEAKDDISHNIASNIKSYDWLTQHQKVKLAKTLALCRAGGISFSIKDFGIEREEDRIEIALIAASVEIDGGGISEYIQNYEIENQSALIRIAKRAVAKDGEEFSKNVQNYRIKDEEALTELAIASAGTSDWGETANCIESYGIKRQSNLIKIAKFIAERDGGSLSENIQKFSIKREEDRLEIAIIAAQENPAITLEHIAKYELLKEENRFEVVRAAFEREFNKGSGETHDSIEFYVKRCLFSQENRIKLAKTTAKLSGKRVSQGIRDFKITDKEALVEIAVIAAAQDGEETSSYIENYEIEKEEDRFEVAKVASRQNPYKTFTLGDKYSLTREHFFVILATSAVQKGWETANELGVRKHKVTPEELVAERPGIALMLTEKRPPNPRVMVQYENEYSRFEDVINHPKLQRPWIKNLIQKISQFKDNPKTEHTFNSCAHWLGAVISFIELSKNKEDLYKKIDENPELIEMIFNVRDPAFRIDFSRYFVEEILSNLQRPVSKVFSPAKHFKQSPLAGAVVMNLFEGERDAQDIYSEFISLFGSKPLKRGSEQLRLIKALYQLGVEQGLSKKEKRSLIRSILLEKNAKLRLKAFKMANAVFLLGRPDVLKGVSDIKEIESRLEGVFVEELEMEKVENFGDKFVKVAEKFRDLGLVFTYAGKLKTGRPESLKLLGLWFRALMEGDYPNIRYENDRRHLDKVFSGEQGAKREEQWRSGQKATIGELAIERTRVEDQEGSSEKGVDINSYLQEKVLTDKHLYSDPAKTIPNFVAVLSGEKEVETALEEIKVEIAKQQEEIRKDPASAKQKAEILDQLKLEYYLALLLFDEKKDIKGRTVNMYQIINEIIPKLVPASSSQFRDDIQDLATLLTGEVSGLWEKQYWTAEETDDAENGLRAGTDVDQSCQKVDGDPKLNRCLMSIMLDGKIRQLVIKNGAGSIVARSLLRVLHDNEKDTLVLVMDRVYTTTGYNAEEAKEILEIIAVRKAKELGVPLLSSFGEEGDKYPNPLISYGGPVRDEYIDILGNRADNNNVYTISGGRLRIVK